MRKRLARAAAIAACATGATTVPRFLRRLRGDHRVFILAYHNVVTDGREPQGTITAARLATHLRYLKERFRVVPLSAAVAAVNGQAQLHTDVVAITFDDGYVENYLAAFPVLRHEAVPAAIFVTTGFLDGDHLWFDVARRALDDRAALQRSISAPAARELASLLGEWPTAKPTTGVLEQLKRAQPDLMRRVVELFEGAGVNNGAAARPLTWDQVREMSRSGIEIGSHTVTHPILSSLSPEQQLAEIVGARDRIAAETGKTPLYFAYPNGSPRDYDRATIAILREAGFAAAVTTSRGTNRPADDPMVLRRTSVGADDVFILRARLAGLFDDGVRALLPRSVRHVH